MPAPAYIISRAADPLFAAVIGLSAAAMRISREEKEKGKTTAETIAAARRCVSLWEAHIIEADHYKMSGYILT